ncbi:hypothetical protein [Marinobacterium sp. MBR-109]|jgi:hypothetical protein|uniref:phage tail terminator protein n=1 Tax=Marinobacterium sp. MBR-109 TaxID=3156462 RepID=UPI00339199A2
MLTLTDDYLAAERELIQLLEQVEGIRKAYSSTDLAEMKERSQITPAVHVIYRGDRIPLQAQGGAVGHVTQNWAVVLAINLRQKEQAGVLLARLVKTLSGVVTPLGPLNRVNAPQPSFRPGFGYYPLAFEIKFRTQGAR